MYEGWQDRLDPSDEDDFWWTNFREIKRLRRTPGERQPIDRDKVHAQTRERVRWHRHRRRRPSADEIAAERKALKEDREERANRSSLTPDSAMRRSLSVRRWCRVS